MTQKMIRFDYMLGLPTDPERLARIARVNAAPARPGETCVCTNNPLGHARRECPRKWWN